jgi:hypothetical protein
MADTANSENEYQQIAKRRWPGYTIAGDGSIAVLYHCTYRVELVTTPIEASAIVGERCGQHCGHMTTPEGGWHEIEKLKLPRAPVLVTVRDWQRD